MKKLSKKVIAFALAVVMTLTAGAADQQDPDRRGQEGGRSEGAESQDRL